MYQDHNNNPAALMSSLPNNEPRHLPRQMMTNIYISQKQYNSLSLLSFILADLC